jgi:hypothetical protein
LEALLNLFWLILALAALALWATRRGRARLKSRFSPCIEVVALVCVLVLLFFSISLTDDLHSEIILITDSSSGRRSLPFVSAVKPHKQSASLSAPALIVVLPTRPSVPIPIVCGLVNRRIALSPQFFLGRSPSNRAPPILAV